MRRFGSIIGACALAIMLVAGVADADVKTRGEIVGTVVSQDEVPVPGATITVTGDKLIQGEIQRTAGSSGGYRVLNLLPGRYTVRVSMEGFTTQEFELEVTVGRSSVLDVVLQISEFAEEIVVKSEVPLIDQASPILGTDFKVEELEMLPTNRNLFDTIDSSAGFFNRTAYGAGGNVETYDVFGYGAATNSYQLNGVATSNLYYGNTWVKPNYDTIQEVQIVGPGAGVEFADYSGAVVNMITKSGTNEYHGSATVYYTDNDLLKDNSGGILDLEQDNTKYNLEGSVTVGGPIVRDKLTFFASAATNRSENAAPGSDYFNEFDNQNYMLRIDYIPSPSHTLTGMLTSEPILLENLGIVDLEETGTAPGFFREQETQTAYVSWLGMWGDSTVSEVRFATVDGFSGRTPNSPDAMALYDGRTGLYYHSQTRGVSTDNEREHVLGTVTHYLDDFLGGTHEIKGGLDYEEARSRYLEFQPGNATIWVYPSSPPGTNLLYCRVNTRIDQQASLERPGIFIQDTGRIGRATFTVGVRYDEPTTTDDLTGKAMLEFSQLSPRLGMTYDFSGRGRTIGRISWGRYYDKVPTYGIGTYAGTGFEPFDYYLLLSDATIDPNDTQGLYDLIVQPENFWFAFNADEPWPVEPGIKSPYADIFNIGFDQQIGSNYAFSASYLNRRNDDFIVLTQVNDPPIYEPFDFTSPDSGRTFPIYAVVGGPVREFGLGNRDFQYQKMQMLVIEFRRRFANNFAFDASLTFEDSEGTRENNPCGILSLCSNGVDQNPNYEMNPFYTQGSLSQERAWLFKLRGTYQLPLGFDIGLDFRYFDGRPWGLKQTCRTIEGCNDPNYSSVYLEPKDQRLTDSGALLNLRFGKMFNLGSRGSSISLLVDWLNVFNDQIDYRSYNNDNVDAVYARESAQRGESVSATGQPLSLARGRELRLGLRFVF